MLKKTLLILAVSLPVAPALAANDAVFSTSTDQYVETSEGGRTLRHSELSRARVWVEPLTAAFVPNSIGLDAVDVLADGRIVFSTGEGGFVSHAEGQIVLDPDQVYIFDPQTGVLSPATDWNATGIDVGPLDGIDRLDDGRYAFSVEETRWLQHVGGPFKVYPENVYLLDSSDGQISMIFDGRALGLPDLDAIHVYGDGRVAASVTDDCFIMTRRGGRTLRHDNVYIFSANAVTTAFEGAARSIYSIDAVDLGETDVWISLDRETVYWGSFAAAQGFDVVRGSVGRLQATGGNFAASVDTCLSADDDGYELSETAVPEAGSGWFYLTRRQPVGWWETFGPGQVAPRTVIDTLQLCQ